MNDDDTTILIRDDGVSLTFLSPDGRELATVSAETPGDLARVRNALADSCERERRASSGQGIGINGGYHE